MARMGRLARRQAGGGFGKASAVAEGRQGRLCLPVARGGL